MYFAKFVTVALSPVSSFKFTQYSNARRLTISSVVGFLEKVYVIREIHLQRQQWEQ